MFDCLLFDAKAFLKLWYYVTSVETEICGIGRIEKDQGDIAHVTDIIILPQVVGGVDANVTAEDMQQFFNNGGIKDEESPQWCFHWHTHPKFSVSPSNVDLPNWKTLSDMFEVFVPMIFNHYGEYHGSIYHKHPIAANFEFKNIWLYEYRHMYKRIGNRFNQQSQVVAMLGMLEMIGVELTEEEIEFLKNEVATKVKKKQGVPEKSQNQNWRPQQNWFQNSVTSAQSNLDRAIQKNLITGQSQSAICSGVIDEDEVDRLMQEGYYDSFIGDESENFTSGSLGRGGKQKGLDSPFNWTKDKLIEEAADYDYVWDQSTQTFHQRGFMETYTIGEMKHLLHELLKDPAWSSTTY